VHEIALLFDDTPEPTLHGFRMFARKVGNPQPECCRAFFEAAKLAPRVDKLVLLRDRHTATARVSGERLPQVRAKIIRRF
jgi:hypothetical protein